jgi:outer membrane protein assembly factor BamE (lipoprotein component of BamABCDE complex)
VPESWHARLPQGALPWTPSGKDPTVNRSLSALTLALPLALGSCVVIGADSHTSEHGRYVGDETLAQIRPGESAEYVVALIGSPTSKTELSDGVSIWKYAYTHKTTRNNHLLFVLDADSTEETSGAVFVQLKDGKVERSWRD